MAEQTDLGTFVCGIGGTPVPPNDPNLSDGAINAYSSRHGIQVNWRYPSSNPHAVAYSDVYRARSSDFNAANVLARTSADNYTDLMDHEEGNINVRYYYWVVHTSINGTVGEPIGPADAAWLGSIDDVLARLQGLITDSMLDEHLRSDIQRISDFESGLSLEEQARLNLGSTLADMVQEMTRDLQAIDTLVGESVTEIIDDNKALAAKVNIVLAKWNENLAMVEEDVYAVAGESFANAGRIDTVESVLTDPETGEMNIVTVQQQMITEINSNVGDLDQLGSVPVYDAEGNLIETPDLTDRMMDIYGQWSIQIDVNGHISGLGLRSNGDFSEFIVNANVFAIGAPEDATADDPTAPENANRPFIVYIDPDNPNNTLIGMNTAVFIRDGTIKNAMIDNVIESTDWRQWGPGINQFEGWRINKAGDAYFDNLTAKGNIEASSIKAGTVDVIDTLMIQGNAVTIPEGVRKAWGNSADGRIEIKETAAGTNLVNASIIWADPKQIPNAFIVNAIYQALGTDINGDTSKYGDAHIELVAEYGYMHPLNPNIMGPREPGMFQILQSYAVTLKEGDGSQVTGIWHVVPMHPGYDSLNRPKEPFHWAHFTIRGMTKHNRTNRNREVINAVMTILGAKR